MARRPAQILRDEATEWAEEKRAKEREAREKMRMLDDAMPTLPRTQRPAVEVNDRDNHFFRSFGKLKT